MADVLALHGFTQRGAMWDEVAALAGGDWAAPDLPGHGSTPPMAWDEAVGWVAARAAAEDASTMMGYSMGGRLALAAAQDDRIGSVSPMCDAAPMFSLLDSAQSQHRPEGDRLAQEGRRLQFGEC